jgi:hypothetical protein
MLGYEVAAPRRQRTLIAHLVALLRWTPMRWGLGVGVLVILCLCLQSVFDSWHTQVVISLKLDKLTPLPYSQSINSIQPVTS